MCTCGTKHIYLSSHCIQLLITPSCYANIILNICLCIIVNTHFKLILALLLCILLLLFYPDICPSSFYSPTCLSQAWRGEGVIQDSYPRLISWDWLESLVPRFNILDQSFILNKRVLIFSRIFFIYTSSIHIVTPSLHFAPFLTGPVVSIP